MHGSTSQRLLSTTQDSAAPGETAVVIYVGPRAASMLTLWCLEPISGTPSILHLLHWLRAGGLVETQHAHIICRDESTYSRLQNALPDQAVVCLPAARGIVSALRSFCLEHPEVESLLIFPETAIFPNCGLTLDMFSFHRQFGTHVTMNHLPLGLLPLALRATALPLLMGLNDNPQEFGDFLRALQSIRHAPEPNPPIVTINVFEPESCADALRNQLPYRVILRDGITRRAAEKVIQHLDRTDYDPQAAVWFKSAILEARREIAQLRSGHTESRPEGSPVILFVSMSPVFSGAEESFYQLITHVDPSRFLAVCVVAGRTLLGEKLSKAGIGVEQVDGCFMEVTPTNLSFWRTVLESHRPLLVHIDGFVNPALMTSAFYKRIPIVYHVRFFFGARLPFEAQLADRIITVSEAVARDVLRNEIEPDRVVPIHNGVDLDYLDARRYDRTTLRAELGLTPEENVLCMVARISPEKHQDLALKSLSRILIAFPDTTFLFVGEAYPQEASYHEYLRKCASSGGLEKRVRWLGFEEDIARVYAICDALVACNPQEPFGRCIIEALAMGLPVIAPRTGGHTEFLLDGHNALLYEPGDSEDLALRAIQLLSDQCVRASIAKNGLETAATLDISRHVARVQDVYENLRFKRQ